MADRRKLAAGNWKMNGTAAALSEVTALAGSQGEARCEILLCPPATLVERMAREAEGTNIAVGGQDCHAAESGAHTGDISARMLKDAGATYVITGHSERRADHGESDEIVRHKTEAAWAEGLTVIVCVGETLSEREASNTIDIIKGQLAGSIPDQATGHNLVVAYEPVWAIGTGKVPTTDQIGEVHDVIRSQLERRFGPGVGRSVRLLYGGSVKAANAAEIFAVENVDGALVGGASLKADDFGGIIAALDG
ncbi:triosephosphate isomerase [Palleronia marisminoris]|uniref:Triosephosphate isomerase n=1 Tax=Palleronia marisminoris TaxID=315423 RepID=A0A1Y5RGD6_9RHOB|nr:triose-phosphate isomerase [Palleronia marisminoris]SFG17414.1 triosephosphate isomerase [Palleronia marisminoris]SLN16641.1 Triosephosphate isomerase [Palleronia marisminoris]